MPKPVDPIRSRAVLIAERIADMRLCGAFDAGFDIDYVVTEIMQDLQGLTVTETQTQTDATNAADTTTTTTN